MDDKILDRANEIARMIREDESALCCFEWPEEYGGHSRNPQLIIEFDGCDGREQVKIPMILSECLTNILKDAIKSNLNKLKNEFEEL